MMKRLGMLGVFAVGLVAFSVSIANAGITIKIGHTDPGRWTVSKSQAAGEVFQSMLESASGGRVKVEVYPASQLGGEREQFEAVKLGTLEMVYCTESPVTQFFKPAMVLSIPYLFKSEPVAWAVFDGPFGKELAENIRKALGIRILAYGEVGFRHFSNSKRPLKTPQDLQGLKIRVMESPVYVSMVKAMGGNPIPIAFPELYTSLQQGVVDGQENPVSTFVVNKFPEVQKYLTLDGHLYSAQFMGINERLFQSYGQPVQQQIMDAARVASTVSRGVQATISYLGVTEAAKQGVNVYVPSNAEKEQFKKVTQAPVIEYLKKELGPAGDVWMNKLFEAIKDAEAKIAKD